MTTGHHSQHLAEKPEISYKPVKIRNTLVNRLIAEMSQFDEEDYKTEFSKVIHIDENTVSVSLINGKTYTVHRDLEFLQRAPTIRDENGNLIACDCAWSPAFTSAKWLLMLAI